MTPPTASSFEISVKPRCASSSLSSREVVEHLDRQDEGVAAAPGRRAAAEDQRGRRHAGLQIGAVERLHDPVFRAQHVAVVKAAAGLEHPPDLGERLDHPQVPGRPLQGHDIEARIGKRQPMGVADMALDLETPGAGDLSADRLHGPAAVERPHPCRGLALQRADADRVGARAEVRDLVARPDLDPVHELLAPGLARPQAGDVAGQVVVGRHVGEDGVKLVAPDSGKREFPRHFPPAEVSRDPLLRRGHGLGSPKFAA